MLILRNLTTKSPEKEMNRLPVKEIYLKREKVMIYGGCMQLEK